MCVGLFAGYSHMTARLNSWLSVTTWHRLLTLLQPSPHPSPCTLLRGASYLIWLSSRPKTPVGECIQLSSFIFLFWSFMTKTSFYPLLHPQPSQCLPWASTPSSRWPFLQSLIDALQYPAIINLPPSWPQIPQLCWFMGAALLVSLKKRPPSVVGCM